MRSLPKHAIDIGLSEMLLETDIFCFTETQLLSNQEVTYTISENLDQFSFLHNRCNDQFQSISFCYRDYIDILENHNVVGKSVLTFRIIQSRLSKIQLCINNINIVLGDFNINAQSSIINKIYYTQY